MFVPRAAAVEFGLKQRKVVFHSEFFPSSLTASAALQRASTSAEECVTSEAERSRVAGDEAVCVDSSAVAAAELRRNLC